jgi:tetratricopeptide (TPR) repeat protein
VKGEVTPKEERILDLWFRVKQYFKVVRDYTTSLKTKITQNIPQAKEFIARNQNLILIIFSVILLLVATTIFISERNKAIARKQKELYSQATKAYFKGRFGPAIKKLKEAARLNPSDAKTQLLLGRAYEVKGKLNKAAKAYKASLKTNPNQPEILYSLAVIYKSQGKTKEAVSKLEKAVKLNKTLWLPE